MQKLLHAMQKWQKIPTDSVDTGTKEVQILTFLHIPRDREQGQICIYGFVSKTLLGKQFLRF